MDFASLFDAAQTSVIPCGKDKTEVQVVSWYDNEASFTANMRCTIRYFSELIK